MRVQIVSTVAVVLGMALAVLPQGAMAGTTVRVDDDGKASATSCSATAAAPRTIQRGISLAGKGGTVIVCPGTYRGSVIIGGTRDGLTIKGATSRTARVQRPLTGFDPTGSVVTVTSTADDILIQGLAIGVPSGECASDSLVRIAGRKVRLLGNSIIGRGWCVPTAVKVQPPVGGSSLVSATIRGNLIRDFDQRGIAAFDPRTTVTITTNDIQYWQDGGSWPQGDVSSGIRMDGALGSVSSNSVASLHVLADLLPVLDFGIWISGGTSVTVTGNSISHARATGIHLDHTTSVAVERNTLVDTRIGLEAYAVTNSSIGSNTFAGGVWGIWLTSFNGHTDHDIHVFDNQLSGFSSEDCQDENPGSVSFGTANDWAGNTGEGDDMPDGICPAENG